VRIGRQIHHHSWALGHPPAIERENGIRKDTVKSKGENNGQIVIPLLQGFHTQ
jgi:hypothetical protein